MNSMPPLQARWLRPASPLCPRTGALDLHVSRQARERFGLDASLFSLAGRLVVADIAGARRLAERLAAELATVDPGLAQTVTPGRIYALGLIHELLHAMIQRYRGEVTGEVLARALDFLREEIGGERLERTLRAFAQGFPPPAVWRGEVSLDDYLDGSTAGRSHREILLEEMLLLWLANASPAFAPFRELFDDSALRRETAYPELIAGLEHFLATQPPLPPAAGQAGEPQDLFSALLAPAASEPTSLSGQLRQLAPEALPEPPTAAPAPAAPAEAVRTLRGLDLLREEERPVFPPGPGPVELPSEPLVAEGPEQFSPDRDWMPNLTLIAKNTLVWLFQLSRQYGRPIERLDQIPDGELELLARRGFTGLWLIGIWERSPASQQIKRLTGNPEAAASAYALDSYRIARQLGGEAALADLAARARRYGLRLGCDMVPNHFGIDSEWVREHPERFLQLAEPPYPAYRYTGPDLSSTPEIGLWIEDHYFDRSDAAVVFKRLDRRSGEVTYLYHGNDGTVTPWNDTAQLDYLQEEVREAVIAVILEVAQRFPIIRFDAAMTLARRHVRRLWFPAPGTGGDIPSRTEHGLSDAEFDAAMPEEFFRQVVDRVAAEAPETLLLAEAFWLMENYFVRSLGMHRVYNSAFMLLLRDERNAEYRKSIRDVLAFDREILKRYVNFMSNPDERTAIDQFGSGDQYFGVCTLMATLPGLPMFGHGQVEGFAERYGMEYGRSYLDEVADPWVVARHERQIFPLLHRRRLFAGSEHFVLYDFETAPGKVDEDVFAFSNRLGDERALVVFHNRPGPTRGRLRRSAPYAVKVAGHAKPQLKWETLGHALDLDPGVAGGNGRGADPPDAELVDLAPAAAAPPLLMRCRDAMTGLEHVFDPREIIAAGLGLTLGGYQCHVFLDFEPIREDADGRWRALALALGHRGVPSLDEALLEPTLEGVLAPFRELVEPELLHAGVLSLHGDEEERARWRAEAASRLTAFRRALEGQLARHRAAPTGEGAGPVEAAAATVAIPAEEAASAEVLTGSGAVEEERSDGGPTAPPTGVGDPAASEFLLDDAARDTADGATEDLADLAALVDHLGPLLTPPAGAQHPGDSFAAWLHTEPGPLPLLLAWWLLRRLGRELPALLDELLLGRQLAASLRALGHSESEAQEGVLLLKLLLADSLPPVTAARAAGQLAGDDRTTPAAPPTLATWVAEPVVRGFLRINRFDGRDWLHRESLATLLRWAVLAVAAEHGLGSATARTAFERAALLARTAVEAGYEVGSWLDKVAAEAP